MTDDPRAAARARLDTKLVEALLERDESAFCGLVTRYNLAMIRLAMMYVPNHAIAEEVAQEAWLALIRGIGSFKGESTLKTWLFGILLNRAKSRAKREKRSISFSCLDSSKGESSVGSLSEGIGVRNRPCGSNKPIWAANLSSSPEDRVLNSEFRLVLEQAISHLPATQRIVVILRDLEGWTSGEVCELLSITPQNQRVRLHRARAQIRSMLSKYLRST